MMNTQTLSPAAHAIIDYILVGSLLTLPALLGFSKKIRKLYAAEALGLLGYVACTDQPVAVKRLIPFPVHGRIDPFNVAGFAVQSFTRPFRKSRKALLFNIAFTAIAGVTVLLTDWKGDTKKL